MTEPRWSTNTGGAIVWISENSESQTYLYIVIIVMYIYIF